MTLATGAGRDLHFVEETNFAETPANPIWTKMRTTGGALQLRKNNRVSGEVRSDRQIGALIYGAERVEGDLAFEYSHGSFDALLEMALMNRWSTNTLKTGSELITLSIEEHHVDNGARLISRGCAVNTMNLSITPDEVTGSFGILGKTQRSLSGEITGSDYSAGANASAVIDGFKGSFSIGGASSAIITQVDISLSNGLEARNALGGANIEPSHGRSNVTGTVSMYFETLAEYQKFVDGGSSSLRCDITDGTNTNVIELPKIQYTEPDRPVSGESDIIISLPFQAIYDETAQSNIVISR